MLVLEKEVKRETGGLIDDHLPAVVTLHKGDVIGIRLKGQRKEYRTTLRSCFHLAVKQAARVERQRREGLSRQR